jgi:hypothetical protein
MPYALAKAAIDTLFGGSIFFSTDSLRSAE